MGGHVGHVVNNRFQSTSSTNLTNLSRQQGIEKSVNSTTDVAAEMIETLGC